VPKRSCIQFVDLRTELCSSGAGRVASVSILLRGRTCFLLSNTQTYSEVHPVSYSVYKGDFPKVKAGGAWIWPLMAMYCRPWEGVEIYFGKRNNYIFSLRYVHCMEHILSSEDNFLQLITKFPVLYGTRKSIALLIQDPVTEHSAEPDSVRYLFTIFYYHAYVYTQFSKMLSILQISRQQFLELCIFRLSRTFKSP
jgi:hypothetical protein